MTSHILQEQIKNQANNIKDIIPQLVQNLPPELAANLSTLITILKALGIVFIIYLIFLIISGILSIRRSLMIKETLKIVKEINQKLDKLLKKRK